MPSEWNYKTGRYEKISSKKRFTDKQRAAYWKKKYLKCVSDFRQYRMGG